MQLRGQVTEKPKFDSVKKESPQLSWETNFSGAEGERAEGRVGVEEVVEAAPPS